MPPRPPLSFVEVGQSLERLSQGQHELSEQIGRLAGEVREEIRRLTAELQAVKSEPRERADSYHDFDPALEELRNTLTRRVKDPGDPRFNSERARAIANEAVSRAKVEGKAAAYDAWKRTALQIAVGILVGVLAAMTLAHFGMHP